jgi:hypothetical protein
MSEQKRAPGKDRGVLAKIFFPSVSVRFAIAILLTFFPQAFMYPLQYPGSELIALSCWIWVFPSVIGFLSFAAGILIPTEAYGYYAFNVFSVAACLAIAKAACDSREWRIADLVKMHKFTKACMLVTLAIAALQVTTDQNAWMSTFEDMKLEPWRGAGLRSEPSQIGSVLGFYLLVLVARMKTIHRGESVKGLHKKLLTEGLATMLATIALTRSITVLIVAACFLSALFTVKRRHLKIATIAALAVLGSVWVALGDRIQDAVASSGGSLTEFMTTGLNSWRNVPDIVILTSPLDFMAPGRPGEVRLRIHDHAVLVSPLLGWIQNTFTSFSASSAALGLVVTGCLILGGLFLGMRKLSSAPAMTKVAWFMAYVSAWFIMAKWDPTMWVVLGMLPLAHRLAAEKSSLSKPNSIVERRLLTAN